MEKIHTPNLLRLENSTKWNTIMLKENVIEPGRFIWNIFEKRKQVLIALT